MGSMEPSLEPRMNAFYARHGPLYPGSTPIQTRAGLANRLAPDEEKEPSPRTEFKDIALELFGIFEVFQSRGYADYSPRVANALGQALRENVIHDTSVKLPKNLGRIDKVDFIYDLMNNGIIEYLVKPEQEFPSHGKYDQTFYKDLANSPEGRKILSLINKSVKEALILMDEDRVKRGYNNPLEIPEDYSFIQIPETTKNLPLLSPSSSKLNLNTVQTRNEALNWKKLLINPITISAVGAVAVAGLEFRGVTDFIPGPSKGATNPPVQVAKGDVMKAITGFSVENASELGKQSQETIQAKIDRSLKELKDQSISVTGYYGGTLKPLTLENAIKGVKIQANVKTQANDQEGKPSVIIFQPGNFGTQIIIAPTEAANANPLKQVPNKELIIVEIPLGAPGTIKLATGNLESLFKVD
jgi:hypothetical protein